MAEGTDSGQTDTTTPRFLVVIHYAEAVVQLEGMGGGGGAV